MRPFNYLDEYYNLKMNREIDNINDNIFKKSAMDSREMAIMMILINESRGN